MEVRNSFNDLNPLTQSRYLEVIKNYFDSSDCPDIARSSSFLTLDKSHLLVSEGDDANSMFILLDGALDVFVKREGNEVKINQINQGEIIGEMALIQSNHRNATVVTRRRSVLMELSRSDFEQLAQSHPRLTYGLANVLAKRLSKANAAVNTHNHFVDRVIHIRTFEEGKTAGYWVKAVQQYWKGRKEIAILHLDSIEASSFELLCKLESSADHLLIYSDSKTTQNVLSEYADKTVMVVPENFETSDLEPHIQSRTLYNQDQAQLIITHSNDSKPKGSKWTSLFDANQIFRIKLDQSTHLDRACRAITGDLICLVLGGGGAHGLSTIGVLKAFRKHEVPIDIIGGTSIGSILTAAIANDWDFEYIRKNVRSDISQNNPLNDYTLPLVALLKGRRLRKVLQKHFDQDVINTWKNCFVVAANLSTSETEIIETGPLDLAILSSISIPGILPPILHKNSLLVDGGVVNNLPVDIMAHKYKGKIIAVDVVSQKKRSITRHYRLGNLGLIKRFFGFPNSNYIPGLMNTVMKSITLSSAEKTPKKQSLSDIYLSPRTKKGFLEWKAFDDFVLEGYNHTLGVLNQEDLKEKLGLPEDKSNP